jgi:hypothetical protein
MQAPRPAACAAQSATFGVNGGSVSMCRPKLASEALPATQSAEQQSWSATALTFVTSAFVLKTAHKFGCYDLLPGFYVQHSMESGDGHHDSPADPDARDISAPRRLV